MNLPRRYFFCGSFMFLFCLVFAISSYASVYMCSLVTCWERAGLLALVCGVYCEFVTFPLVSWVRCGTWLYRFLIFAPLLTLHFRWHWPSWMKLSNLRCFFCGVFGSLALAWHCTRITMRKHFGYSETFVLSDLILNIQKTWIYKKNIYLFI